MGGLTLGAISPLGLSLPQVLANEASGSGKQINVIFMFLQGGASQLDMYDMKPDAPIEVRGKYHPISTNVPGMPVKRPIAQTCPVRGQVFPHPFDAFFR